MQTETRKNTTSHYGGYLFIGTIVSCDPGTMVIELVPDGQQNLKRLQGIPLASTFAHALGFKETILPNVGARVLCFGAYSGSCIIIGTIPPIETQSDEKSAAFPAKGSFGVKEPLQDQVHSVGYGESFHKLGLLNNQLPTDVVQGEKVFANEFGVTLGLFQLLSVLKGSELAQVQCHFLDDLVRIISHNFQHYTALGEHSIFHDGKGLHLEVGITHDPKESIGIPQTSEAANTNPTITDTKENTDTTNFFNITDERLKAIERIKLFVGKLGDLVNLLIVAPANEARKLDGENPNIPDRGLLQVRACIDGLLVVRSVKGIILEKTNWIRVPVRIRTPEDPEGDDGSNINYELREAFGFDDSYTESNTPFLYYLQLKDYLSYIEEDVGYSGFKTHSKDFYVNDDYTAETPLESFLFVDPITGVTYQKKRSIIALMPNGGLSLSDAWGSAINMEGGNIYIQPAKDLVLQPMRNIVAKVGANVSIAAKKEIDLSSTEGGMRIKTNNSQYLYSQNSGIVLHSDGQPISDGFAPANPDPVESVSGIVLKAPNAGVTSYGKQVYSNATSTMLLTGKNLALDGTDLQILSDTSTEIYSGNLLITAKTSLELFSKASAAFIGDTSTIIGKKGQTFGVAKAGVFIAPVEGLLDSLDKNKDFFTKIKKAIDDISTFDTSDLLFSFKDKADLDNLKFYYLPSSKYILDDSDIIPQTMVQLEEATFTGLHQLEKWVETPVNNTYPYPGLDEANSYVVTSMKNMDNVDQELVNKVTSLVADGQLNSPVNLFKEYTVKV